MKQANSGDRGSAAKGNAAPANVGDGTFENEIAKAGAAASGWSSSADFFDYDNYGKLDAGKWANRDCIGCRVKLTAVREPGE